MQLSGNWWNGISEQRTRIKVFHDLPDSGLQQESNYFFSCFWLLLLLAVNVANVSTVCLKLVSVTRTSNESEIKAAVRVE